MKSNKIFYSYYFHRNNPAQIYRLTGFILRDISAIRELEVSNGLYRTTSQTSLTNIIIHMLFEHDIGEPSFADLLLSYLGRYASHFCHELYVFASSPFDLIGYDRNVLFNDGPEFEEVNIIFINIIYSTLQVIIDI